MQFEKRDSIKKAGRGIGYAFAYLLFTTILFTIVRYTDKMPESWGYLHIAIVTSAIALLGFGVRNALK